MNEVLLLALGLVGGGVLGVALALVVMDWRRL